MIVQINNHDLKVGFGLYFIGKAIKKYNTDLSGLLASLIKHPISDMVDLMWYSAECEAELDGKPLPITKREFVSYLEKEKDFDKEDGILGQWSQKFVDSIKGNFLPEDQEETGPIEDGDEKKN